MNTDNQAGVMKVDVVKTLKNCIACISEANDKLNPGDSNNFGFFQQSKQLLEDIAASLILITSPKPSVEQAAQEHALKWIPNEDNDDRWDYKRKRNERLFIQEHFEAGVAYAKSINPASPHPSAEAVSDDYELGLHPHAVIVGDENFDWGEALTGHEMDCLVKLLHQYGKEVIKTHKLIQRIESAHPSPDAGNHWQLCPKCGGQGTVTKPPWVAGDVQEWSTVEGVYECNLCQGKMVILSPMEINGTTADSGKPTSAYNSDRPFSHAGQRLVDKQLEEKEKAKEYGNSHWESNDAALAENAFLAGAADTDGRFAEWSNIDWVYNPTHKLWYDQRTPNLQPHTTAELTALYQQYLKQQKGE